MKNILFQFVLVLALVSCATIQNTPSTLFQEYSQYDRSANKNNIIDVASDFFSPDLLGTDYQTNPDAASQLLFKHYMAKTGTHYEKLNGQEGCLTINGYDEENIPLIISLKYISRNNHWLIDEIHIAFIENKANFADSAQCPDEYPS